MEYWCCKADFGEHETSCKNYRPNCPKCGRNDEMIKHGDEWVCHHTHVLTEEDFRLMKEVGGRK